MFEETLREPRRSGSVAKALLLTPMTRVRFPAAGDAFLVEAKSENAHVFEISVRTEGSWIVGINPEPSITARLIACVVSAR